MYHRNLRVLVLLTISKSDSSKEALICVNPSGLRDRPQWILRCKNLGQLMSALGQKRTLGHLQAMSLYPQKRTSVKRVGMSTCTKSKLLPCSKSSLIDHLVGDGK